MLSIQVSDTKNFMSHLLSGNTFDHFYFIEASIKMGVSYQIQGRINEGFYDTSVEQTLCLLPVLLIITTGISYKNFSLDKSLEYAFDEYLAKFLKEKAAL